MGVGGRLGKKGRNGAGGGKIRERMKLGSRPWWLRGGLGMGRSTCSVCLCTGVAGTREILEKVGFGDCGLCKDLGAGRETRGGVPWVLGKAELGCSGVTDWGYSQEAPRPFPWLSPSPPIPLPYGGAEEPHGPGSHSCAECPGLAPSPSGGPVPVLVGGTSCGGAETHSPIPCSN